MCELSQALYFSVSSPYILLLFLCIFSLRSPYVFSVVIVCYGCFDVIRLYLPPNTCEIDDPTTPLGQHQWCLIDIC